MRSYAIYFSKSAETDLYFIKSSLINFASYEDAEYVVRHILSSIEELENPFFNGVKQKNDFFKYVILGGSYIVFYKENKIKNIRYIFYIKSARMKYQKLIK